MKLHQLSLFLENRPGKLKVPCRLLADAGINLLALSLADTAEFGILRLIVRDWQRAKSVLDAAGCAVKVTEVLAVDVPDRPGGLAQTLEILDQHKVGIEYMYAFTLGERGGKAALIFRFTDPETAMRVLAENGINVLDGSVFERMNA